jgi:hypothetical protein
VRRCPIPETLVNAKMGHLVHIGHEKQKRVEVSVDCDLWCLPGAAGKIAHFGDATFAKFKIKWKLLPKAGAVGYSTGRNMLHENRSNLFRVHGEKKKALVFLKPSRENLFG